ncbi:ATP phosphoribosyltransferase [Candidatus Berkiella cookevillensis]|uniref:ATP phosphoribosyltransferase n=1 Tax=Candidatus Berkiella cookevillensis TaxID=437022 RepID=A0A0Q9YQR6_9GAMM|nr:ATP phosphoribosyltransferase [Candidatus Berkiella cookevillensis]MCS5708107.1 ATP phosphoribosyltransferase [Candidatus Berkiella cookevillensis]
MSNLRLKIALQKKGRLSDDSIELLRRCGLKLLSSKSSLFYSAENYPIDLLLVRDDDIPTLIQDGICDLGIVGDNVLKEKTQVNLEFSSCFQTIMPLNFGRCRLSIAVPKDQEYQTIDFLQNKRIATSYPILLQQFLKQENITAQIVSISGSVEIAPGLNMADAIFDLVSTGRTLAENNLKELYVVLESQAVFFKSTSEFNSEKKKIYDVLLKRIQSVIKAQESKYILFHAPRDAISKIREILPGCESPTILPLEGSEDKVAVHVVSRESVFWNTLEKLQTVGASAILVLPVEKMMA